MIEKILIITFLVYAIWYTYQEGEIFGFVQGWQMPHKFRQPLFDCNVCMSPWYGSILYWLIYRNNWIEWLIVVISAMGVNAIINRLAPDK